MTWTLMNWLEAGGYVVAIVGGLAGGCVFIAKQLKKFAKFEYPVAGEVGPNILNAQTSAVRLGEHVSLSAVVPEGAELLVAISGQIDESDAPKPGAEFFGSAAWNYSVAPAPLNWRGRKYVPGSAALGPTQNFIARSGPAELEIHFCRLGPVAISVYERGRQIPTWTKTIQVLPKPQ